MRTTLVVGAGAAALVLAACPKSEANTTPAPQAAPAPAAVVPAAIVPTGPDGKLTWKDIQPLFAESCDPCHGANPRPGNWVAKAKRNLDTSTYPFGGIHGGEILDSLIEVLKVDPTGRRKMPMDDRAGYPEDKAQKIVQWVMDGALDANGKPAVWPPASDHN